MHYALVETEFEQKVGAFQLVKSWVGMSQERPRVVGRLRLADFDDVLKGNPVCC